MQTNHSIWTDETASSNYPSLSGEINCDVVIIGGGITGITSAILLQNAGLNTVVLEAGSVGKGTTGHSTGNLYSTIDMRLHKLIGKYDQEVARKVVESRKSAVDLITGLAERHAISCEFRRTGWHLFASEEKNKETVEKEFEAMKTCGLNPQMNQLPLLPVQVIASVSANDQAQLNPYTYVRGLAEAAHTGGCKLFENSRALEWEEDEKGVKVRTSNGIVRANFAIMATHTPAGIEFVQTLLGPYREYGIAAEAPGCKIPDGIFWSVGSHHHHSVRNYKRDGKEFVVVVGEHFKTGQEENTGELVDAVASFLKKCHNTPATYSWGAQHYRPADGLPYIGRKGKDDRIFYATGFSTDGLTYGTLAAMLIRDQILDKKNDWQDVYEFARHRPAKAAAHFVKENLNVAGELIKGKLGKKEKIEEIRPGEGGIIFHNGKNIAVYCDESGKRNMVSAACTHMGCTVQFNSAERSWDCPCHGSRFTVEGKVIEGPAVNPLEPFVAGKE